MNWLPRCDFQEGVRLPLMLLPPQLGSASWPAAMIVWGAGFKTRAHRHHCVQLIMMMRGSLRARRGPGNAWRKYPAILVRPDAVHEIDARGGTVLIGFVDAESELGRALCDRVEGNFAPVPARQVVRWRAALGPVPSEERVDQWVRRDLLPRRRRVSIHPRVRRVLTYLKEHAGDSWGLSLSALAGIANLSQSRFMHVFTESLGVPIRPYILWLRLQRAACALMGGASVSSAADSAGFSDAAHLTRTFRRMLGATPTDIALRKKLSRGVSIGPPELVLQRRIVRDGGAETVSIRRAEGGVLLRR